MWNLVKYEIRGYYKELCILAGCIVFLNLLLLTRIDVWPREAIVGLSMIIMFVSSIIVFIWNIALFNRDIYGNTGYLLFSLPQKGWSILTAKLLGSFVQMTLMQALAGIFVILNITMLRDFTPAFKIFKETISFTGVFFGFLAPSYLYVYLLIFIYFCITISTVAIGKRKLGKFGAFISFIVLSIVTGKFGEWLMSAFPQSLHFEAITAKGSLMLSQYGNIRMTPDITINIASTIFDIIVLVVFFVTTSYLLEKKVSI